MPALPATAGLTREMSAQKTTRSAAMSTISESHTTTEVAFVPLRTLLTQPLPPTTSPPPPPSSQPAPGGRAAALSLSTQPTAPCGPVSYEWTFSLPYTPNLSFLLSRFILSRVDGAADAAAAKEPKRKQSSPPQTAAAFIPLDPHVTISLASATAPVLLSAYSYCAYQQSTVPTLTPVTATNGVGTLPPLSSTAAVDPALCALTLTRDAPLLVELYFDPIHLPSSIGDLHTRARQRRAQSSTAFAAPSTAPLASPPSKKGKAVKEERESTGSSKPESEPMDQVTFELHISCASPQPISLALDVSDEERRRETKAAWEKAEPGRTKRGKAARDAWISERADKDEEDWQWIRLLNSHVRDEDCALVSAEEKAARKAQGEEETRRRLELRDCLRELRRVQIVLEDDADRVEEAEWRRLRAVEEADVQREAVQREAIRAVQQREEEHLRAIRDVMDARHAELEQQRRAREAGDEKKDDALAVPAKTPKRKDSAVQAVKGGKAVVPETAPAPPSSASVRRAHVDRLEALLGPLLALPPTRQWKVVDTVERTRRAQRQEVEEELADAVHRLRRRLEDDEEEDDDDEAPRVDETPMPTGRADGKAAKPKDPKAEKAEREKREAERKHRLERLDKARKEKVDALRLFGEAEALAGYVRSVAPGDSMDSALQAARGAVDAALTAEVARLLGRMPLPAGHEAPQQNEEKPMESECAMRPGQEEEPARARSAASLEAFLANHFPALSAVQRRALFLTRLLDAWRGDAESALSGRAPAAAALRTWRAVWAAEVRANEGAAAAAAVAAAAAAATLAPAAAKGKGKGK